MSDVSPFSKTVIIKALPAIIVIFLIFISLMFLISYTEAFYLVILIWIVAPVILVKFCRWAEARLKRLPPRNN